MTKCHPVKLSKSMEEAMAHMAENGASGPDRTGLPKSTFEALERRGLARFVSFRRYRLTDKGRASYAKEEPAQ